MHSRKPKGSRERSPINDTYLVLNDVGVMWLVRYAANRHGRIRPVLQEFNEGETSASALIKAANWQLQNRRNGEVYRVSIGDALLSDELTDTDDETLLLKQKLEDDPSWLCRFQRFQVTQRLRSAS